MGVFDVLELLVVEAAHGDAEPLVDLGPREPPGAADLPARQLAAGGQLLQLAGIAAQVAGQLIEVHGFAAHTRTLLSRVGSVPGVGSRLRLSGREVKPPAR